MKHGLTALALATALLLGCDSNPHRSGVTTETENGLTAVIVLPDGRPASKARIRVRPVVWQTQGTSDPGTLTNLENVVLDTITDSLGELKLPPLSTGTWMIVAEDEPRGLIAAQTVQQAKGRFVLGLQSAQTLHGTVLYANQLQAAWIRLPGLGLHTNCDSLGQFAIAGVPQGFINIQALAQADGMLYQKRLIAQVLTTGAEAGIIEVVNPQSSQNTHNHQAWTDSVALTLLADSAGTAQLITNFPLLVRLDATQIDFSKTKGHDLHFDRKGHRLPYEVELWDSTYGKAAIWVKMDSILPGQDLEFGLWYGNPQAQDSSSSQAVFGLEEGNIEVWHLSNRSSARGNTLQGSFGDDNGIAGMGVAFLENQTLSSTQQVLHPTSFTISAWIRANAVPQAGDRILALGNAGTGWQLSFRNADQRLWFEPSPNIDVSTSPIWAGVWHWVVGIMDSERGLCELYLDGLLVGEKTAPPMTPMESTVWIGESFWGAVDEVRIRSVLASPDWITLEYATQKPGSTALRLRPF